MNGVDEIKSAITKLTLSERGELVRWLHNWQDDAWDNQISADAKAGRLNRLLEGVDADIRSDRLKDLP